MPDCIIFLSRKKGRPRPGAERETGAVSNIRRFPPFFGAQDQASGASAATASEPETQEACSLTYERIAPAGAPSRFKKTKRVFKIRKRELQKQGKNGIMSFKVFFRVDTRTGNRIVERKTVLIRERS